MGLARRKKLRGIDSPQLFQSVDCPSIGTENPHELRVFGKSGKGVLNPVFSGGTFNVNKEIVFPGFVLNGAGFDAKHVDFVPCQMLQGAVKTSRLMSGRENKTCQAVLQRGGRQFAQDEKTGGIVVSVVYVGFEDGQSVDACSGGGGDGRKGGKAISADEGRGGSCVVA